MEDGSLPFSVTLSDDITPPLSPVMSAEDDADHDAKRIRLNQDLDLPWDPPRFDCSKYRGNPSLWRPTSNGFFGTRTFSRLLEGNDLCPGQQESCVTQLFGFTFITSTALIDQRQHLFSVLRQAIGKIESLLGKESRWSITDGLVQESEKLREDILFFFTYVHSFLQRWGHNTALASVQNTSQTPSIYVQQVVGFPAQLVAEITLLSNFVGKLSDLPGALLHQHATSQSRQASHNHTLLHCHLDVRWYVIQILHQLHVIVAGSSVETEVLSCLNSQVEDLMQDLISIAIMRYNKLSMSEVHQAGFFPCACMQELWLLLLHLLDYRQMELSGLSFWGTLHQLLYPVFETQRESDSRGTGCVPEAEDPVGFCLWLLQGVSPIYQYDRVGQKTSEPIIKSHWFLVEDLMKKVLSKDQETSEAKVQSYLHHLLGLCDLWEPHPKLLASLWDYCYRKLNQRLNVPSQGIQGLASISKSALSWFQACKSRCDGQPPRGQDTSFHLFLRILATKMTKWNSAGNGQPWKQLQGRLYSKFHSRTMQELGEIGLQRFFDLFLTLGFLVDLSPLTSRVLDFLDLMPTQNLNVKRRLLIWRGLFALCLIHEEKQCDLETVAERLAASFNTVCRSYVQLKSDPLKRSDYWSLITCYVEGAQEVLDSSSLLSLSEDKLIAPGLGELLSSAGDQEMRTVLMFVQTSMAGHRSLYKRVSNQSAAVNDRTSSLLITKYKAFAHCLWTHVFPFIKQHATTQTPPPQLADVAASFTLLAADLPNSSDAEVPAVDLFRFFGLQSGKVNPSVTARYLCHLLPNQAFLDSLHPQVGGGGGGGGGSLECTLVRAWLHTTLQTPRSSEQVQELGRLILKLPQVVAMVQDVDVHFDLSDTSRPLVFRFLRILGTYFASAQTYQDKLERRSKTLLYLGDLVTLVRTLVRGQRSLEEMSWMYHVIGHAVKFCSGVLYSQGSSQSQLPGLLTELILFPGAYNAKKTLPPNQQSAIRDTLHLFVEGLSQHDISRDSYIQRKLKEITSHYFLRYKVRLSTPGSSTEISHLHPLLRALQSTFRKQVEPRSSALRKCVLSEFRSSFLSCGGHQVGQHTAQGVTFLQELMYRTTNPSQVARDTPILLGSIMDHLLLSNSAAVKGQMSQLLTQMMNACKTDPAPDLQVDLREALRGFLTRHLYHHRKAALGSLESVAVLHPGLVAGIIPDCTRLLEDCEHRRAVGADGILRQAYYKVLSHLGDAGRQEREKLQAASDLDP
ncbi:protein MMS22-like [Diadema antillarum]|uniref:protein MMS22-like n=1 Tax=Diadema antillarum TaxID=105358 RepID=UPI003A8ACD97